MSSLPPPSYTRYHWAKFSRDKTPSIHLLEHHLADVGACMEALLQQPTIRQRLARAGGLDILDDVTAARLCVFAALHDIGKVNVGFQTRIWEYGDFPSGRRPIEFDRVGHTADLTPVLNQRDSKTADWFFDALDWWWESTESWDNCEGEVVCAMFVAALSHHGSPLQLDNPLQSANPQAWREYAGLNPQDCVARIGQLVRQWFEPAFGPGALPLPLVPEFQHHFLGLCTLADWIGSNEDWFHYVDQPDDDYISKARERAQKAVREIGLDIGQQRRAFATMPPRLDFAELFRHPEPNAIQQQAAMETALEESLVIIESETGSGKTEAALWRFARMYQRGLVDGLYFALPTRAAASQLHQRVKDFVNILFPAEHCPQVILAVPGYNPEAYAPGAVGLQEYDEQAAHRREHGHEKPWASERPKQYLAAQIAVGTVDQAMLGALRVRHSHLRSSCLARNLLVVDEVHASDTYMTEVIRGLLAAHTDVGGYALLMSATLGATARQKWLSPGSRTADVASLSLEEAIKSDYPAISVSAESQPTKAGENGQDKTVKIEPAAEMVDFDAVARRALAAARQGAKVLIVRNTVDYAVKTQRAVEEAATDDDRGLLFTAGANNTPTLHHGRFARSDRRLLDSLVKQRLGKSEDRPAGGGILVGTQTLEQSLDLDADLLLTDLCPVDVLLQRIGRLHRHHRQRPAGYSDPTCVVLLPDGDDLTPYLTRKADCNGLGPNGYVYRSLHVLEATRRLARDYREWRIPEMNRELVEKATHPEALEGITESFEGDVRKVWNDHANKTQGANSAEWKQALDDTLKFNAPFYPQDEYTEETVVFADDGREIRTRLGDNRVEIVFDPQPPSPFDPVKTVDRLEMRLTWLNRAEVPESLHHTATADGFEFSIEGQRFRYDRLGLRRL